MTAHRPPAYLLAACLLGLPFGALAAQDQRAAAYEAAGPALPEGAFGDRLRQCYAAYADSERAIDQAGTADHSYFKVAGFPYVRSSRLLVSYLDEIDSLERVGVWLEQLRDNDGFARDIELRNMGMDSIERANLLMSLRGCAVWLSLLALDDPAARKRLEQAVADSVARPPAQQPPSPAGSDIRAVGPAQARSEMQGLTVWGASADDAPVTAQAAIKAFRQSVRDELGRVGLQDSNWRTLAHYHAPTLAIASRPSTSSLGTPVWSDDGTRVTGASATVHFHPAYARVGGQTLLQFVYFIWSPTSEGEAGVGNGLIWRTTLGPDGLALVHDSMRMDGSEHIWFPAKPLTERPNRTHPSRVANIAVGQDPVVLLLRASDHGLLHVAPREAMKANAEFSLARYENVFLLEGPEHSHHLYAADGQVAASRAALWQYGRHPAPTEDSLAFDDPLLIESVFEFSTPTRAALPQSNAVKTALAGAPQR